jgi:hypothetical protein
MLREIYNRDPSDPNYKAEQIEVTDALEACIGKLKMLIFTRKGEVLGDPRFGLNLEDLIYDFNISEKGLRNEIQKYLITYIPDFDILGGTFETKFFQGTNRDIATIDFKFPSNSNLSPTVSLLIS